MLFFLNPITSLVGSLSQEKVLTKAYLGLSEAMNKPITNSIGEFRFYYGRFLGYIIHNLETITAEIEDEANAKAPTEEVKALPTPEVKPTSPDTEIVEAGETEDEGDWPIPENPEPTTSLKDRMLTCKCQQELEAFKVEIGTQKATELWENLDISERNHIKSINLSASPTKAPATTGYLLQYTDGEKNKHKAQLIGHYLYGEPLKDSERSILILGELKPIVVKKSALRPYTAKDQKPLFKGELEQLQHFLTEPQTQDDDEPTAETVAANTFTGLATPKPQTGSQTGKKPESRASEPSAGVQIELKLQTPDNQELPPTPTPALEVIASELKRFHPQNTLTFTYETTPHATFLTIKHGDSQVACFEDDGSDIYEVGESKLTFHGFTKEQELKAYCAGEDVLESLKQKKA
ncbi:MAG: hypothetical protein F6K24_03780 [Okeania sp. SIO2D1]|nr:hypothetical protein [Okeania sp. SIO2D1]